MSIKNFRAAEALYLVIIRNKNGEQLLRDWARSANAQVSIENNRMKLFEHQTLASFQLNWPHDWSQVTIWDCWNRRHIGQD